MCIRDSPIIARLNAIIKNYAQQNAHSYLDYYSEMVDSNMGLIDEYTYDGVHPNKKGYEIMSLLASKAIRTTLDKIKIN